MHVYSRSLAVHSSLVGLDLTALLSRITLKPRQHHRRGRLHWDFESVHEEGWVRSHYLRTIRQTRRPGGLRAGDVGLMEMLVNAL